MREQHPAPQRVIHILIFVCGLTLIITGLLIHWPPRGFSLYALRYIHIIVGIILLGILAIRICYAFIGGLADWREFDLGINQWRTFPAVLRYYLLFRGPRPGGEGYNILQRLAYIGIILLVFLQGYFGLALTWPRTLFLGHELLALWGIHYGLTWIFIAFGIVHHYLVIEESREQIPAMLLGRRSKLVNRD